MKTTSFPLLLVLFMACSIGCSTLAPAPPKDLSALRTGMKRAVLLTEFGAPLEDLWNTKGPRTDSVWLLGVFAAEDRGGIPPVKKVDAFVFIQGYERPAQTTGLVAFKRLEATGIWKQIRTPPQTSAWVDLMCLVSYDKDDFVTSVTSAQRKLKK